MWPPTPAALAAAGTGSQPAVRRGLVSQPAGQRGSGEHTQHERCHAADAQNGGRAPPKHWLSTLVAWNWPARPASGSNRAASTARASAASAQLAILGRAGIGRCDSQIDRGRRMTVNATLRSCAR